MNIERYLPKVLMVLALLPALCSTSQAQNRLETTALGPGITLITGAGSNVVVAEGPDSIVIVDGGLQENAEALLAEINRLTGNKPVAALFNTNWRRDKSGLNHVLGPQGVRIIAHENTRLWQGIDVHLRWSGATYLPLSKNVQANDTFYKDGSITLGTEVIEYGWLGQASTDGDIFLRFRNADVLLVGDTLGVEAYPQLDYVTGGWVNGARTATESLIAMAGANTRVVASQGPVQNLASLQEQSAFLEHAYTTAADAFRNGLSLDQYRDSDPMAGYREQLGDPSLFLELLYTGIRYHVQSRAVPGVI